MDSEHDTPEEVYQFAGELLFITQSFEDIVGATIKLVYSDLSEFDIEAFYRHDKKTLGMLLRDLRKQVEIEDDFDDWLKELLQERNFFAHQISREPWFDPDAPEGRKQIWEFYSRYYQRLETAMMTFGNILFNFAKETGVEIPGDRYKDKAISDLQSYSDLAAKIKTKG